MSQLPTDPQPTPPTTAGRPAEPGLDAAQQSLSDALRVSFAVLKVLMVVLVIVYAFSGIVRVDEMNTAVRYRFGEPVGTYGPGWHIGLPYPIEEIRMVPRNAQTLRLDDSFWYDNPQGRRPEDLAFQTLDPLKDSFLITGDTNVIHVQFEVVYVIRPEDVSDYVRNVGSIDRANELVRTAGERGMIHAIAGTKVNQIINNNRYPETIKPLAQEVLDGLGTGITIQQVLIDLKNQSMPNQVRMAYDGVTQAQADKAKTIQEARLEYNQALGQAAGSAHGPLMEMIRAYDAALGRGDEALAVVLRDELNRSLASLRLPEPPLQAEIGGYLTAITRTADTDTAAQDQAVAEASTRLQSALSASAAVPEEERAGARISGEVAGTINLARAGRTEIVSTAKSRYQQYVTALEAYRAAPMVLANDRWQQTREFVLTGPVEVIYGDVSRLDTTGDPAVQEELNEIERQRRTAEQRSRGRQNP